MGTLLIKLKPSLRAQRLLCSEVLRENPESKSWLRRKGPHVAFTGRFSVSGKVSFFVLRWDNPKACSQWDCAPASHHGSLFVNTHYIGYPLYFPFLFHFSASWDELLTLKYFSQGLILREPNQDSPRGLQTLWAQQHMRAITDSLTRESLLEAMLVLKWGKPEHRDRNSKNGNMGAEFFWAIYRDSIWLKMCQWAHLRSVEW